MPVFKSIEYALSTLELDIAHVSFGIPQGVLIGQLNVCACMCMCTCLCLGMHVCMHIW